MKIALIVAMSENGVIGDKGKIPWHIREDLQRFKRLTLGHPIIMGRRTYESIGKPLPGRTNIVLTQNPNFAPSAELLPFASLDAALNHCRAQNAKSVFIIGGSKVYQLRPASRRQVVRHRSPPARRRRHEFPDYDRADWTEVARRTGRSARSSNMCDDHLKNNVESA